MQTTFINTKNSKMNEKHIFFLNLSPRLDAKARINMLHFKTFVFIKKCKTAVQKQKTQNNSFNME